jgi:hypothetical protein
LSGIAGFEQLPGEQAENAIAAARKNGEAMRIGTPF